MNEPVSSRKVNILVVDDDRDVREVLAETLVDFGYSVLQAGSGTEALALLGNDNEIGMMITDIRMPGMNGLELAERARHVDADLKVILISGYFVHQPVNQRFLRKPFHMQELASAVQAELG
jgi:two-component system cell cycle response regulator CpdR